jgi:uncharacterized protein
MDPSPPPIYAASVQVFVPYLVRVQRIVGRAGDAVQHARIADSFSADQHFATAAMFALRIACPLAGRDVPRLGGSLAQRLVRAIDHLNGLPMADFNGAEVRRIRHVAGFADLDQPGIEFLYQFGIPNFFFHLTMGYAGLRAAGMTLGKADFDGLHHYPPGFSF